MTTPRPPARSQVVSPRVLGEAQGVLASMKALHHGQSASLVPPELGSCASSARVWRLWAARHSQSRGQATGSQPLPQVLELAASKVADFTAFDHVGLGVLPAASHLLSGVQLWAMSLPGEDPRATRARPPL